MPIELFAIIKILLPSIEAFSESAQAPVCKCLSQQFRQLFIVKHIRAWPKRAYQTGCVIDFVVAKLVFNYLHLMAGMILAKDKIMRLYLFYEAI